ncbi:unnamed protein product [Cladocopium goreaui]|uniref:Ankyrin-2 n=1 Tax=Cladocopium goreaui TaxID=2562237 RepID=A0A9P1GA83_9DINO|nr:unnamed protein product [Cladocopium goreaui]
MYLRRPEQDLVAGVKRKEHGEDLWQMPSKDLKLIEDERIFIERPDLEDACHRESGRNLPCVKSRLKTGEIRFACYHCVLQWSNGGRSTGRRSDASTGRDPWARRDPWSVPRSQAAEVRAPGLESEFLQFLQWRAQASAVDQGLYQGHQEGSNRALWQAAREEHERTTAGPPPEWDGISTEFRDYKLKAKIWLRTTRTPAHARGPLLLKNLSKGPWEDLKFLASDEDWLTDPTNGTKLLELMDSKEYYGEEQRESMLAACSRLTFHLKRQRGESARQFMTRWDTAERKVREHEVRLPQDFLGFLMVNALQLDSERTKLLLNYTKGSLKVSDVKEWLRIHETDLDLSTLGNDKKKSAAYFLDQENAKEIQLMDIPESDEDMETESSELLLTALADLEDSDNLAESNAVTLSEAETKEILLTMVKDHKAKSRSYAGAMKAKKNRDLARGFGAGRDGILRPGTYEVSISELKKRTKCNACGQTGHWARECPSKGKKPSESSHVKGDAMKPKTKELNFLQNSAGLSAESEFFYLESMGSTEPTNAQSNCGWDAPGFCDEQDDSAISELVTERAYMVYMHFKMPGPRGLLLRQMEEMAGLLEPGQMDQLVFHTVGMVQGDRLRSTAEDPTKEFKYEESGVPHRLPVHSGPSSSNYVGDPAGSTSDSGCSEVHMRPSMPSLGIQDREESRSSQDAAAPPVAQHMEPEEMNYYMKRHQEVCQHKRLSRAGTNAFLLKEICRDCGKVVTEQPKPLTAQTKKEASQRTSSPSRSSTTSTSSVVPNMMQYIQPGSSSSRHLSREEYQDFLNWLAQRYPAGLVNAILIAYASSIGLGHHLLYLVEGNAVFEKEKSLENNLILCGDLCPEGQLSTACRSADGNPPELPRPGLLAEVHPLDEPEEKEKFPGTHPLSLEALVKRAHEGLGHPGKDRFIRILTNSKASPKVLEIAKNLKCSVCEKFKLPRPSRAAAPPKDIGLNEIVGVDTIQLRASFSEKTKYCINIIDYSSHFQLIVPLTAHTAEATRAGYRLWLKIFGPPRKLLCDLGREFQKQFETLAEADGSELIPSSLETPEQRGFVERHGQLFKEVFYKTIEQTKCSTWDEWYQTIDLACSTKNRLLSRGGFSPAQRVFGFQQRIPGGLMSEGESDLAVQSLAATGDVNVSRSMMIRKAAAQSFHEVDCQQAIRAAATHGPRPHYAYETGQAVYFWRRATDAARKPASYFWHGPARVVATQLPTTVWLSYNHHLVKAAPEKLRPASEEEFFSISGWLEGISNAKMQFEASKVKGLIDLSQENDELPPAELHDFWRQEGNFWIRVHVQPRRELFHPEERGQDPPVPPSHLRPWRRSVMNITDGDQEILEDDWTSGNGIPAHRQEWTGETWLEEKIDEPSRLEQKREADPLVPRSRLSKKSRVEPEQMIPFSQAPMATPETALETPEPIPVMPEAPPGLPAPDPPLPEVPLPDPPEVEPQQETRPLDDNHQHPEERKREFVEVDQPDADWSSLPVSKRSRLELLEIYYQEISNKSAQRQKKGKEATLRDFQGKDRERLLRAIHKEFNNNLATGAYEVLTPQESARIRASSPEKIMKSRYVLTKKPIEDCGLEDAISADEILDSSEKDQPCKAKCRHVMQGYSESALLDLETSTPQVHRDSVIFAAQIMASKHWTPGFADFTQAFHSGDPIDRELYAEQPAEGLPGASKGQLLKLKKTCYGLTDGPYAWFKHIVTFLCEQLGYRQSVVDQCLFFLDSEPDAEGKSSIEGIIALATDDLFHGGSQRHFQLMEIIRSKYKLGKYTWGQGRFVGKDIRQLEDFSILVDQQFYTEARVAPIPLQRERKRRRFSVCNPEETEQLRALVGTLSWLSKETRCDLAGKTALLQQAFPRPMIRDIITANQIAQEALDHKHLGIRAMSIPLDRLHAGVVTDASWGNSKEFGTYLEAGTTKDRWEETSTSWIRHHVDPRITAFHPAACPDGPDLHDLRPERSTEIRTGSRSTTFQDDWTTSDSLRSMSSSTWTGTTTFYKQDEGKSLDSKAIHAGYDQLNKLFSQGGEIVIFYDQDLPKSQTLQNVSLASWKSYRLKRRTVNTLSSETQALVRGLSSVHWYRVLILEAKGLHLSAREWHREVAQLPFICVTDSKSLYDTICKCTNPASQCEDKRTSIDISLIKQEIAELNGNIRWIDGRTMLADSLTKESKADLLRHVMNTGQWSILEEGSALQRKLLERTSKHEVLFIF